MPLQHPHCISCISFTTQTIREIGQAEHSCCLQCTCSQAVAVIEYLYTGSINTDVSTAAEVISLANLWQLPGNMVLLLDMQLLV